MFKHSSYTLRHFHRNRLEIKNCYKKLRMRIRQLELKLMCKEKKNLKINRLRKENFDFKNVYNKFLPCEMATFFKQQLLLCKLKKHGQRYSIEFKEYCFRLYFKGPKMLSSIFILSSIKTLRRIIDRNLVIKCGINQNIFVDKN